MARAYFIKLDLFGPVISVKALQTIRVNSNSLDPYIVSAVAAVEIRHRIYTPAILTPVKLHQ